MWALILIPCKLFPPFAKKRGFTSEEPAPEPSNFDDLADDDEDDFLLDNDFEDEEFLEDEYFEDEDVETCVGDGAAGRGIALKEASSLAEQVSDSFDGQLTIYALRQVWISSMSDVEDFSTAYRELLYKAEQLKSISDNT